jgi:membrane protein implicated in regulation of membrane protease activity
VNLFELDPAWLWLGVGALLAIAELLVPGVFLVWIAAAAFLTGIATFAMNLIFPVQLVVFALFSVATVLIGRKVYERSSHATSDPLLNDRAARLVGQVVTVVAAIDSGEGRVKVGDTIWLARGPDAPAGTHVRITGAEGSCLTVIPVEGPLA